MTNTQVIDTPVTHTQTTDHSGGTGDPGRRLGHGGGNTRVRKQCAKAAMFTIPVLGPKGVTTGFMGA